MAEKEMVHKERDVTQIVRYLTNTMNQAMNGMDRAIRDETGANASYIIQTEFAYLLNEVIQGPPCVLQKHIAMCNDFIDEVMQMKTNQK